MNSHPFLIALSVYLFIGIALNATKFYSVWQQPERRKDLIAFYGQYTSPFLVFVTIATTFLIVCYIVAIWPFIWGRKWYDESHPPEPSWKEQQEQKRAAAQRVLSAQRSNDTAIGVPMNIAAYAGVNLAEDEHPGGERTHAHNLRMDRRREIIRQLEKDFEGVPLNKYPADMKFGRHPVIRPMPGGGMVIRKMTEFTPR